MNKSKTQLNKGFTLIELVITMVILGIFLAISVNGLLSWQDWSDFNRENEYAETMFVAAQNQLSNYATSGELPSFSNRAKVSIDGGYNEVSLDNIIYNAAGDTYSDNSVWNSGAYGHVMYAIANKGDYVKYLADPNDSSISETAFIVFELLESYIYDKTILNETICIEFSLDDGQVFSVLFTDKYLTAGNREYEAFEYNSANKNTRGLVNIAKRDEAYRKERMIGYYGVDTLSHVDSVELAKTELSNVKLNNEETLNVSFEIPNTDAGRLEYVVNIYDEDNVYGLGGAPVIQLTVPGSDIKEFDSRCYVLGKMINYAKDGSAVETDFPILAWSEVGSEKNVVRIRVALDAADAQAVTNHYADYLDGSKNTNFDKTLSFHRFDIDSENISCTVKAQGAGYKTTTESAKTETENAYFESCTNEVGTALYEYEITNGRHLYNVRYVEDISNRQLNDNELYESNPHFAFYVSDDVDWTKFVDGGNYYSSNASIVDLDAYFVRYTGDSIDYSNDYSIGVIKKYDVASFSELKKGDSFVAYDVTSVSSSDKIDESDINTISGLYITEALNTVSGIYGTNQERPLGLFNVNSGKIEGIILDKHQVISNNNKVGAFCGVNICGDEFGSLGNLYVLNSGLKTDALYDDSLIKGNEHVGGIVGYLEVTNATTANEAINLTYLENSSRVTGNVYVGGIVGEVRTNTNNPITISKCNNFGMVLADNTYVDQNGVIKEKDNFDPNASKYIGGITGFCDNRYAETNTDPSLDVTKLIVISECNSAPYYSDVYLDDLFGVDNNATAASIKDKLNGVYVGGIVGYNYYSTIENCYTVPEAGKRGYVFGYKFVGGIVGFNQGPASGIRGGNNSDKGVNYAYVCGYEYVGGITGCNADIDEAAMLQTSSDIIIPDNTRNLEIKVDNWTNKGIVFSTYRYAGGITGYNTGWIYNCNSEVDNDETDAYFQSTYSTGDYAGGIAGYNNGLIGNTLRNTSDASLILDANGKPQTLGSNPTVCYISGRSFVGGVVGYNDVDAIIEDYQVAGGKILGSSYKVTVENPDGTQTENYMNSYFVGGFVGFNASFNLILDDYGNEKEVISCPNNVKGEYFVGGSVGGNVLDTSIMPSDGNLFTDADGIQYIKTNFETDNFLGKVDGKMYVGGFLGYNLILNSDGSVDPDVLIADVSEKIIVAADGALDSLTISRRVSSVTTNNNLPLSTYGLYIGSGSKGTSSNSFGRINAENYVGGVLGYNDENTYLYVNNIVNSTPIYATVGIEDIELQNGRNKDYEGRDFTYSYAYAGGIIGEVGPRVTIDDCSNTGVIRASGTYTGGLCEVNRGKIINCELTQFGSSINTYLGGFAGLNMGLITDCSLEEASIGGKNVVGGVAAENFGLIKNIKTNKIRMSVSGKNYTDDNVLNIDGVAGALVGYNGETSYYPGYSRGTVEVDSDVLDINIVSLGRYAGGLIGYNNGTLDNKKANKETDYLVITGNVKGRSSVGGVIGKNKNNDSYLGLADNYSGSIAYFENDAVVSAVYGTVGGIIGENASRNTIIYCTNKGTITAINSGYAGGVVSHNQSKIRYCYDHGIVESSNGMSGGITAVNEENGLIDSCYVMPYDVYLDASSNSRLGFSSLVSAGGVAAENKGVINWCIVKNVDVSNKINSKTSDVGVITGVNDGTINLSANTSDIYNCTAKTYTNHSNVGGVVGYNKPDGRVYGVGYGNNIGSGKSKVNCNVFLDETYASVANLGGVAGTNEGLIAGCMVSGTVTGLYGDAYTGYGGIAGYSGIAEQQTIKKDSNGEYIYTAKIIDCSFDGDVSAKGTGIAIARVGGIAGINGHSSKITGCVIGVDADTRVYAGNIDSVDTTNVVYGVNQITKTGDPESYSYVGGIAGENYGAVMSCDNYTYSTKNVLITNFAGISGGIVAYSYMGSTVTGTKDVHLTTGRNWQIIGRASDNNAPNGGIVGTFLSYNHIKYCDNYAYIQNLFNSNTQCGGIVGSIDQNFVSDLTIAHCNNYGDILSTTRAGGITANLRFKGAYFIDCNNYGSMTGLTADGAAGFIAHTQSFTTDIVIYHCTNYGTITAREKASGFYGIGSNSDGSVCTLIDCVNLGTLRKYDENSPDGYSYNVATSGSFSANFGLRMDRCRSYVPNENTYSFANAGCGSVRNCFDINKPTSITGAGYPFSSSLPSYYNFYYDGDKNYDNSNHGTYFSLSTDSVIYNTYFGSNVTDYFAFPQSYIRYRAEFPSITCDIDVTNTAEAPGMDSFVLYLSNDGGGNATNNVYKYSYKAVITDENNSSCEVTGEMSSLMNLMSDGRVEFNIAELLSSGKLSTNKIKNIKLTINNTNSRNNVYLYGYKWKPVGCEYEIKCASVSELVKQTAEAEFKFTSNKNWQVYYAGKSKNVHTTYYRAGYFDQYSGGNHMYINNSGFSTLTFEPTYKDSCLGMDKFYIYTASVENDPDTASTYQYYVSALLDDGTKYELGTSKAPLSFSGKDGDALIIDIPDEKTQMVTKLTVNVKVTNNNDKQFINGFKWLPVGYTEPVMLAANNTDLYAATKVDAKLTKLYLNGTSGDYSLITDFSTPQSKYSIDGITIDPTYDLNYDLDHRMAVYNELDDMYMHFLYSQIFSEETVLAVPGAPVISTTALAGRVKYSWNEVRLAAGYETYYQILDAAGNVLHTSDHTYVSNNERYTWADANRIDLMAKENSWPSDLKIKFYVRSVNGYHFEHEGEDGYDAYDSPWVSNDPLAVPKVLPAPKFHFEWIDGNQTVAVLDNLEEYQALEGYADGAFRVEITLDKDKVFDNESKLVTIDLNTGLSEPHHLRVITGSDDTGAIGESIVNDGYTDKYMDSARVTMFGRILSSNEMESTKAFVNTRFHGFYGTNSESLKYMLNFSTSDKRDMYIVSDIVAVDDELGVEVAYSNGNAHIARAVTSGEAMFDITLADFPVDILGKDVAVRSYYFASQTKIVLYGHDVIDTPMEITRDNLVDIVDERYINSNGERQPQNICDVNDGGEISLKPGYVLYKQNDGKYLIYYNAPLEMSIKNKDKSNYQVFTMEYNYADGEDDIDNGYDNYKFDEAIIYPITEVKTVASGKTTLAYYFSWPAFVGDKFTYRFYGHRRSDGEEIAVQAEQKDKNVMTVSFSYTYTTAESTYTDIYIKVTKVANDNYKVNAGNTTGVRPYYQNIQPAPVIENASITDEDKDIQYGHATYTFTWDKNLTGVRYDGAKYKAELYGVTAADDEILIETTDVLSTNTYTFVDKNDNWDYPAYRIKVTRIGTANADNKSIALPRSVMSDKFIVKLKLLKVTAPEVELNNNASGFDNTSLKYRVVWAELTNDEMIDDLGGYIITAKLKDPSNGNYNTHYYIVEDIKSEHASDSVVDDCKTNLEADENAVVTIIPAEEYIDYGPGEKQIVIDLSDFETGEKVAVSVRAIARKNSALYKDGDNSDAVSITIPARLSVPEIYNVDTSSYKFGTTINNGTFVYDESSFLTISELGSGLEIKFTDPTTTASGKYHIAIAAFDNIDGVDILNKDKVAKQGDAADPSVDGYWNSGSTGTIVYKSNNGTYTSMTGTNLGSGTYLIPSDVIAKYAGQWLKIVIRSTTDNKISSLWTDEDTTNNTVNYFYVQVPRVKLPEVDVTTDIETNYLTTDNTWSTDSESTHKLVVNNRVLTMKLNEIAEQYKLQIVGADGNSNYIFIIPNADGTYDVKGYKVSSEELDLTASEQSSKVSDYGTLSDVNDVILPYERFIDASGYTLDSNDNVAMNARLIFEDDGTYKYIKLVLPDVSAVGIQSADTVDSTYYFTTAVAVCSSGLDGMDKNFEMSDMNVWSRYIDGNGDAAEKVETIPASNVPAPPVDGVVVVAYTPEEEGKKRRYRIISKKKLVYRMIVRDGSGNIVAVKYGLVAGDNTPDGTEFIYQAGQDIVNDLAMTDYDISVAFAEIGANYAVSDFTEFDSENIIVNNP